MDLASAYLYIDGELANGAGMSGSGGQVWFDEWAPSYPFTARVVVSDHSGGSCAVDWNVSIGNPSPTSTATRTPTKTPKHLGASPQNRGRPALYSVLGAGR
jgi:hypothetical protein